MMDAKGVRNKYSILVVVNKHNTARVAYCWFIIYYKIRYYRHALQQPLFISSGGQVIWHYCFTVTRYMFASISPIFFPLSPRYHPTGTHLSITRCIADTPECLPSVHMRCGAHYEPWVSRRMYSGRGVNLITHPSPPVPRLRTSGAIPLHHHMAS